MVKNMQEKLNKILYWQINKPRTDEEWAEDIKKESLHFKFDKQLEVMERSHENKIPTVQKDLDKFVQCPACIKWELRERIKQEENFNLEGKTKEQFIEDEYQSQLTYYKWKKAKLEQSVERIKRERDLRKRKKVYRKPKGTTYYVDFSCATPGDGSTATCNNDGTDSFNTLDAFTTAARSAGDIAIVRGSLTQTVTADLAFTSDGVISNPIIVKRDYGDEWSDHVDLSGTGTATLTFGSKTVTYSADISGVLSAGDWIYVSGDTNTEFAYEVESVSTVTVTLYLPYKGAQAGSGKTTYNMGDNPIWNTAAGVYEVNFDGDDFWKVQGLHLRGTDVNGVVEIDSSGGQVFKDMIFETNGANDMGIFLLDHIFCAEVIKSRFYNYYIGIRADARTLSCVKVKSCLFDGNNVSVSQGIVQSMFDRGMVSESEFKNHKAGDLVANPSAFFSQIFKGRNLILSSTTEVSGHQSGPFTEYLMEDYDGVIGDARQLTGFSVAQGTPSLQSETTVVRAGGGATSIKVTPSTNLSTNWELSKVLLFEYPVYADTTSKTYTVYFKSSGTGNWTDDPTNTELWIEAEYWGHATNNFRKITKSTGVCDFNGDDVNWLSLTVTAQPSQSGVLYLRGYYCKTKEAESNIFYVDTKPVIS